MREKKGRSRSFDGIPAMFYKPEMKEKERGKRGNIKGRKRGEVTPPLTLASPHKDVEDKEEKKKKSEEKKRKEISA